MSRTGTGRAHVSRGYLLVAMVSLLAGIVGTIPFVLAGYAVIQWVLAPLGLARADSSNDDGAGLLVLSGVLLPALLLAGWVVAVRWLVRRYALVGATWVLGLIILALPVALFAAARTAW